MEQSHRCATRSGTTQDDYKSLSDDSSELESIRLCRYNISPITSEEECNTSESNGNESDETESVMTQLSDNVQPMESDHDSIHITAPAPPFSSRTTYRICGDNIDKTIRPRYMRCDGGKANSIHYFHSYAVADRINFSDLSEDTLPLPNVSNEQLAISLLPSIEDDVATCKNFATLVSRALVNNVDFFKLTFDGVVEWHIQHEFSEEMSKKSEIVSSNTLLRMYIQYPISQIGASGNHS